MLFVCLTLIIIIKVNNGLVGSVGRWNDWRNWRGFMQFMYKYCPKHVWSLLVIVSCDRGNSAVQDRLSLLKSCLKVKKFQWVNCIDYMSHVTCWLLFKPWCGYRLVRLLCEMQKNFGYVNCVLASRWTLSCEIKQQYEYVCWFKPMTVIWVTTDYSSGCGCRLY